MSDLRKEYNDHKKDKAQMIDEASTQWVDQNIVLISERISRRTVKSLTDKIVKFDKEFGPFKSQLPAIADQISQAETGLQKIVTGHSNDDKAMKLLKQLAYLYNAYSEYFNRDLPVILATPLLRGAQANPEVKLNVLQTPGHDPSVIRDAFKHSLEPSKEEHKLLKKIYRGTQPLINASDISAQMLNLSFNELSQITKTEKVPMVDFPADMQEPDQEQEGLPAEAPLQESKKKRLALDEAIDREALAKLAQNVGAISRTTNIPGMENINTSLKSMVAQAQNDLANDRWNIPGKPSAAKQLISFYNVLSNLKTDWPMIKKTFADSEIGPEEKQSIQALLTKSAEASQGLFKSIAGKMGLTKPHFPGLEPETVVAAISAAIEDSNNLDALEKFFNSTSSLPDPTISGEPAVAAEPKNSQGSETMRAGSTDPMVQPDKLQNILTQLQSAPGATTNDLLKLVKDAGLKIVDS